LIRWHQNVLGLSAPTDDAEYAISRFPTAHLSADLLNFAGEFQTRDIGRVPRRRRITPKALPDVGTVQSRCAHTHEYAIGRWRTGRFDLANF